MSTETPIEILLVEDNENDAELTLRALRKRNLANHVHWVKDGEEALNYFFGADHIAPQSPKLVLLDLKLPKVNGLEVLRRLKSDERTRLIPVVVMTSSNQEPDIVKCYQLGGASYLVKPVKFDSFSEVVAQLGMYWLVLNQQPKLGAVSDPNGA